MVSLLLWALLGCKANPSPAADGTLASVYDVAGDDLFPEGIAADEAAGRFLVGSLSYGSVDAIDTTDGAQSSFFEGQAGWSTLGLTVDAPRGLLWACATGPGSAAVWRFDLGSGERSVVPLDGLSADAGCNDLCVDEPGNVYVSDSQSPWIYRIPVGTLQAEAWSTDPRFSSFAVGLNGLVAVDDLLLIGRYSPPLLFRVPLGNPADVQEVAVDSFDGPGGADGFSLLPDGRLAVTFDDGVLLLSPDSPSWGSAQTRYVTLQSGLTTSTLMGGSLYVINGQAARYIFQQPAEPFQIVVVPTTLVE